MSGYCHERSAFPLTVCSISQVGCVLRTKIIGVKRTSPDKIWFMVHGMRWCARHGLKLVIWKEITGSSDGQP
jgi:hypothetical protein